MPATSYHICAIKTSEVYVVLLKPSYGEWEIPSLDAAPPLASDPRGAPDAEDRRDRGGQSRLEVTVRRILSVS